MACAAPRPAQAEAFAFPDGTDIFGALPSEMELAQDMPSAFGEESEGLPSSADEKAQSLSQAVVSQAEVSSVSDVPEPSLSSDSVIAIEPDMHVMADTLRADSLMGDSVMLAGKKKRKKRDWATWKPDPQKALWLAMVLPGAGQIYNRKYWKLPIFYGGFLGCIYAMRWNNMMYKDYSQAYLDIMDSDPTTESYNSFLHLGVTINDSNRSRYQTLFKNRKDKYRRWRDLSFFVLIGVYVLSVIDAYVDAELSVFDMSDDLSLKVRPTVIQNKQSANPLQSNAPGVQIALNF